MYIRVYAYIHTCRENPLSLCVFVGERHPCICVCMCVCVRVCRVYTVYVCRGGVSVYL